MLPLNILLIDDHTLFRQSLLRMLEGEADWKVVGDFASAAAALDAVRNGMLCDIALIDFELGNSNGNEGNGLQVAEQLRQIMPSISILMVTAGMGSKQIVQAVQDAKVGIFLKNEPAEELFLAMRHTARGEVWVSSAVAISLIAATAVSQPMQETRFSVRERQVLGFVLEGLTNKEIGVQLNLSESLVKATFQKLFEKTGVRTRSQLVRIGLELQADSD